MANKKLKAPKTPKMQKVEIVEKDGVKKLIGRYDSKEKIFYCDRKKSEHFMRKYNAWGLDKNTVDFLVKERATIRLKDRESKWEYQVEAVDVLAYAKVEEHNQHRAQYFLHIDKWEVLKIKNRSMVLECLEIDCRHNFTKQCTRGVIMIGRDGECSVYEDKRLK